MFFPILFSDNVVFVWFVRFFAYDGNTKMQAVSTHIVFYNASQICNNARQHTKRVFYGVCKNMFVMLSVCNTFRLKLKSLIETRDFVF